MTTLVYRDGILAAETQITYGSTIMPGGVRKIHKLKTGDLYGFTGSLEAGQIMLDWFRDPKPSLPDIKTDKFEALLVSAKTGKLMFYESQDWIPLDLPYVAMGSGKEHAYGALLMGADAKQAVRVATKLDCNSGGKVNWLELKNWKGLRSHADRWDEEIS